MNFIDISLAQVKEAIQRHEDGESWQVIADSMGTSRNRLRGYVSGEVGLHPDKWESGWVDHAACGGMDPTIFEHIAMAPLQVNVANAIKAQEICATCPVKLECSLFSSHEDRTWTTRGGMMPTFLRDKLKSG